MRLLYGDTLLPRNVQRRQWVNRNHRLKVVFNVAGWNLRPMPYSAKTQRIGVYLAVFFRVIKKTPSFVEGVFFYVDGR